jgi:hypothetical protein
MWLKHLRDTYDKQCNNGPLSYLNLRFDLHIAVYMIEVLKPIVTFSNVDGKFIMEFKDKEAKKSK